MLPDTVVCHDLDDASARLLAAHLADRHGVDAEVVGRDKALQCDLVLLATTALEPYIPAEQSLRVDQVVLNISLRDLAPELLLGANNVLDDVEHCLKAGTSPHLAEQLSGGRDFVTGTLAGIISGQSVLDSAKPTVFSPFGLGVLDLAVGYRIYEWAREAGSLLEVEDFFGETTRW
jgi:ornithine cyclodeaminase